MYKLLYLIHTAIINNAVKNKSMKSTQQMLAQSRERAYLNRCKTPLKTWMGGLSVGVPIGIFIGLFIGAVLLDIIILK